MVALPFYGRRIVFSDADIEHKLFICSLQITELNCLINETC